MNFTGSSEMHLFILYSARHLPPLPEGTKFNYSLPRPVILDTHLRSSLESKLLNNYRSGIGRRPWIVASRPFGNQDVACNWDAKRIALEKAGARIIEVPQIQGTSIVNVHWSINPLLFTGKISVPDLLKELKGLGIRSLMVEGGARVIKSFLVAATPSGSSPGSVDTVLVTVAPVFVGEDGTGYGSELASDEVKE